MSKKAPREWVIIVRLSDGGARYFCEPTGRQGQEEWSPRANQATRFRVEAEAIELSQSFQASVAAKEYIVMPAPTSSDKR